MRKMKDSGIEWIGEIPASWDTMRLRNHFSFGKGLPITKADLTESGVSVISYGQIHSKANIGTRIKPELIRYVDDKYLDTNDSSLVSKGSFIFADTSEDISGCGNCVYVDVEYPLFAGYHTMILRPENESFTKYYSYLFATDAWRSQIRAQASGVKLFSITQKMLQDTVLIEPSEEEKVRIVDYLDKKCAEIDAIIAAKEKTNELLKERRQSIIYEAVTKGLDPTVPMKDSGIEWIGEIPESWDVCPVKYVIDKNHPYPVGDGDHGLIKADDYLDEGIPYIRVLNLTWGEGLNLENLVYISDEMNSRIKNSELKPNDILIAKTGATIGKTAIVPVSLPRSNTTSHVGKITISSDHNAVFFYYVMTSSIVQKQIQDLSAMQSTRPELGIDGLRNLLVVVPPVEEQQDISEFLNQQCAEINSVIDTNKSMIDKLKEYRQSVIYEAVTGKVEI